MRPTEELSVLKAWAADDGYKGRVARALEVIEEAVRTHKCYVAFSGGKDSTCLLHLALKVDPDILVFHWDYGPYYMPRPLEKEIIQNAWKIGARNLWVATSSEYMRVGRGNTDVWGKNFFGWVIPKLKGEGYSLAFVGLRKEESGPRRRRITQRRSLGIEECWPMADWTWRDVWAYILSNDLPILSYYLKMGPIVGWDKVRLGTLFGSVQDELDGLVYYRYRNL
jgi:3'-phosphoadenosine 5'-phosphosulfate sulfotransferase (PAPS reductase)/FAD synthetase